MHDISVTNIEELTQILLAHGVPVAKYGTGAAKTLEHLFEEFRLGECVLRSEEGRIVRVTRVLCLDVYSEGKLLVEDKQVFLSDGRERRRALDSSMGEKMRPSRTGRCSIWW